MRGVFFAFLKLDNDNANREGGVYALVAQQKDSTSSHETLIMGIGIVDDIILIGLGEDRWNIDYRESLKNHLRNYLFLLHLTDKSDGNTLETLYEMYSNPLLVKRMHLQLKTELNALPPYSATVNPTRYKLIMQLDEWFEHTFHFHTDYDGTIEFYDVMAEHVRTIRTAIHCYRTSFN